MFRRLKSHLTLTILYAGIALTIIILLFNQWGYDDPYITFRYADNLRNGFGFVYNQGDEVLSTTTPLFTMILTAFAVLGANIPVSAFLLGAISLVLGGICLWDLANSWNKPIAAWFAMLVYPFFPLLLGTLSSETPLFLLFCLSAFALYTRKRYHLTAVVAAFALLLRPEGAIVILILLIDYMVVMRKPFPWIPALIFILIIAPWMIYATVNFGSPIPTTLEAKRHQGSMAISPSFFPRFFSIIERSYLPRWQYWLGAVAAALGIFSTSKKDRGLWLLLSWAILHFISFSFFGVSGYYWYYAPLVPSFIIAAGVGVDELFNFVMTKSEQIKLAAKSIGVFIALGAAVSLASHVHSLSRELDPRLQLYKSIGEWLEQNTKPDAVVGSLEVGIIGFYSKRTMIDFAGIIQPEIAERLTPSSTYEDSTLFGIHKYEPEYLVLSSSEGIRVGEVITTVPCKILRGFDGLSYGYTHDLSVYRCEW